MTTNVRAVCDQLDARARQELLMHLLREHFASVGETEVEVLGDEDAIVGYLTPPGVRCCHLLGLDPRNVPPELAGPHYPAGTAIKRLEQMESQAGPIDSRP